MDRCVARLVIPIADTDAVHPHRRLILKGLSLVHDPQRAGPSHCLVLMLEPQVVHVPFADRSCRVRPDQIDVLDPRFHHRNKFRPL